jgi:hypothetical protein
MPEVAAVEAPAVEVGPITEGRFELPAEAAESVPEAAEQAPATEPEVKPEEKPTEPDPEKRKESRRVERKIGKMYQRMAEATARADLLERQLNELKQPARTATTDGAPKLENYSTIEEYAKAYAEHEKSNAITEFKAKQQEETQAQARTRLATEWEQKAAKGSDKYDDYDEVVGDLKPTTPWAMALMQADNAEEIAYHLGKNIKEAQRIAALDPMSQIREIGRLEARLQLQPQKSKAPSTAPDPIKPLTGTSVAESGPSEEQDMATWIKARNKQLRR